MATIQTHPPISHTSTMSTPFIKSIAKPHPIAAGVVTGQIAGLVMGLAFAVIFATALDAFALYPLQLIGSGVLGESALMSNNVGAMVLGFAIHQLIPTLIWGAVFGLLAKALSITTYKRSLLVGVLVGAVAMIVDSYFVVPYAMNFMQGTDFWNRDFPRVWQWVAHIAFGASFVLYPKIALGMGRKYDMVAKETRTTSVG